MDVRTDFLGLCDAERTKISPNGRLFPFYSDGYSCSNLLVLCVRIKSSREPMVKHGRSYVCSRFDLMLKPLSRLVMADWHSDMIG